MFRKLALLIAFLCSVAASSAQPAPDCSTALEEARSLYVSQQFDLALPLIQGCLSDEEIDTETRVEFFRLSALIALQQGEVAEARSTILRLLSEAPAYTPDPIQDPPTYVALVGLVRAQLGLDERPAPEDAVAADTTAPVDPAAVPDAAVADTTALPPTPDIAQAPPAQTSAFRPQGALSVIASLGASSYGGERGIDSGSVLEEFFDNGGPTFQLGAGYRIAEGIDLTLTYRAARFATLLENDIRAEDVQVRPDESSAWTQFLSFTIRRVFGEDWRVAPTLHLGFVGSLGRINDAFIVGVGPVVGGGVDVAITPEIGAFAEVSTTIVYPGDAIDRVDTSSSFGDWLTFVGVGVRTRIAGR